jgi:uncharacterized alpha-E superfamily protein
VHNEAGYEAMVALFDSTITFHAQYQQRHDIPALLDLLVIDRDNPRSLAGWRRRCAAAWPSSRVPRTRRAAAHGRSAGARPEAQWTLEALCTRDAEGHHAVLQQLLSDCVNAAYHLSDDLTARYFTHSGDSRQSVGA